MRGDNVFIDLTGRRVGRLTVLHRAGYATGGKRSVRQWLCQCDCGNQKTVRAPRLRNGLTQSCGCINKEKLIAYSTTHGMRYTSEYKIWASMITRCTNPIIHNWKDYGGRGISVCERWLVFENFFADMGIKPPGYSIERNNNNGNYEPGNCRWASRKEQGANKRNNVWLTINGVQKRRSEWAREAGMPETTLIARLRRMSAVDALTLPHQKPGRKKISGVYSK